MCSYYIHLTPAITECRSVIEVSLYNCIQLYVTRHIKYKLLLLFVSQIKYRI